MFWWKSKEKIIKELQKQVSELQHIIHQQQSQKNEYHIHIEKVDIHSPTLEELSFHLDEIDIEELSGALNVGNNFVNGLDRKNKTKSNQKNNRTTSQNKKIKSTKNGYNVSFHQKEEKL